MELDRKGKIPSARRSVRLFIEIAREAKKIDLLIQSNNNEDPQIFTNIRCFFFTSCRCHSIKTFPKESLMWTDLGQNPSMQCKFSARVFWGSKCDLKLSYIHRFVMFVNSSLTK